MQPKVTREALATFILRTLEGEPDTKEWQGFMVTHYLDREMEAARHECVRLIAVRCEGDAKLLTADEIRHLKALADVLV